MESKSTQFHVRPARPDEAALFFAQHPSEDERLGASGSGKSTLLHLLAGNYPCGGKILVDGQAGEPCDHVFIHQNVFLFDDTLGNNITLWKDLPAAEIERAVSQAGSGPVLAVCAAAIFISFARVVKLTQPIAYRR